MQIPRDQWPTLLATRLRGGPSTAWEDYYASVDRTGYYPTFDDMQTFLSDRFGDRHDLTDTLDRITRTTWSGTGGASALERHIQVFQDARLICAEQTLPDIVLTDRFIASLPLSYSKELWRYEFRSAYEAYEAARSHCRMHDRVQAASSSSGHSPSGQSSSSSSRSQDRRRSSRGRGSRSGPKGPFTRRFHAISHDDGAPADDLSSDDAPTDDRALETAVFDLMSDPALDLEERLHRTFAAMTQARARAPQAASSPPTVPQRDLH
jgi:hypothetical protein